MALSPLPNAFNQVPTSNMCRPTVQENAEAQVLERLQARLQAQMGIACGPFDHLAHIASRGSGPRVFCGHVPPECTEELVKAHFSQWGHVTDVYFPKRKDTFRRRPFCFVTFALLEDAQRAVAESPMNICGIPIKQLNLVEDRADYYKHRQQAAQGTLVQALQSLALLGVDAGPSAAGPPAAVPARAPAPDLANLAALLSLEGGAGPHLQAALAQACPLPQGPPPAFEAAVPRYPGPPTALPFANLPGFSQAAGGLGMPSVAPMYPAPQPAQALFPQATSAALAAALAHPSAQECRLSNGSDWPLPAGVASPFSTVDAAQHASAASSPPRGEAAQLAAGMSCLAPRTSGSSGSASPGADGAAANRLAMWQLQNELLAGAASDPWAAPTTLVAPPLN